MSDRLLRSFRPTIKQKKAVAKLVENSRNVGEALIKAGYSKATAIKPSQVTNSTGFKEAVKEMGYRDWAEKHLKKVQERMDEEVDEAKYNDLSNEKDRIVKQIELLSGRETDRMQITIKKQWET